MTKPIENLADLKKEVQQLKEHVDELKKKIEELKEIIMEDFINSQSKNTAVNKSAKYNSSKN